MVRAVVQGIVQRALDDASGGPGSNRRSDGWCNRWSRKQ
jgi:hypothetical protein